MKKLYIFDCDGTLVEKFTDILLPGVLEWFQAVDWSKTASAIATNQGGVGLRYWMEKDGFGDPSAYPRELDVERRIVSLCDKLDRHGRNLPVYISYAYQSKSSGKWGPTPYSYPNEQWSMDWRKPNPGMLKEAMIRARVDAANTTFVGDRGEDEEAAANAGVKFVQADEFFGRGSG